MSMWHENFFRERIGGAHRSLLALVPSTKPRRLKLKKPSREMLALGACYPKKHQRAEFLHQLFEAEGDKICAMLRSDFPVVKELITARTRTDVGDVLVTYGIDHLGPFAERLEKRFLMRGKKMVRRRVSFEELVLSYQGEDPDALVMLIRNFIVEVIGAIEEALLQRRR